MFDMTLFDGWGDMAFKAAGRLVHPPRALLGALLASGRTPEFEVLPALD